MSRQFVYFFVCCLLHLTNVTIGRLCSEPASDVVFLVDDSGSLKPEEFHMELEFVANMVMYFHLGPKNYQAGMFTFSTDARPHVHLGEISTNAALAAKIKQIPYHGGFTFLGKSLKTALGGFAPSAGGRKNVRKVLVIITDGNTVDVQETAEAVKLLQQSDIQIFVIAFGSTIDPKLTLSLVSKPSDLFTISKISDLDSVRDKVKMTVCIDGTVVCGTNPMDIVFVLDESFSIKLDQFIWLRMFVSRFVTNAIISPANAQVSVVAFADKVRNVFWLNDFVYKDDIAKRIHGLQRLGGMTYTNLALEHVRLESFKKEHGGRNGAQKIVVVLTDGQSLIPEETIQEAQGLHRMGAFVFAIGVGQAISIEELKRVASSEEYVFTVASFGVLAEIEEDFHLKVCKGT